MCLAVVTSSPIEILIVLRNDLIAPIETISPVTINKDLRVERNILTSSGKEAMMNLLTGLITETTSADTNDNNKKAYALIEAMRNQCISYNKIAAKLNEHNFQTSQGKIFIAIPVQRIFIKFRIKD